MGLDMSLFRVITPDIKDGEHIKNAHEDSRFSDVRFINVDNEEVLCDTIKKLAVRCVLTEEYYDIRNVIADYLMAFNLSKETATDYAKSFSVGGSSHCYGEESFNMYSHDDAVKDFVKTIGINEKLIDASPYMTTTIKSDGYKYTIVFKLNDPKDPELENYKGKYIISKEEEKYAVKLEEVEYQRRGLNDTGWDLLPENCCYCDDKNLIRQMTERGGLSKSFIDEWIDGETVFRPWW